MYFSARISEVHEMEWSKLQHCTYVLHECVACIIYAYLILKTQRWAWPDGKLGIVQVKFGVTPSGVLPRWLSRVQGAWPQYGSSSFTKHWGLSEPWGMPQTKWSPASWQLFSLLYWGGIFSRKFVNIIHFPLLSVQSLALLYFDQCLRTFPPG